MRTHFYTQKESFLRQLSKFDSCLRLNVSREDSDFPVFTVFTQPVKLNPVTYESEKTGCMKICSVYEIPVSHRPYTWNKFTSFFFFFFFFKFISIFFFFFFQLISMFFFLCFRLKTFIMMRILTLQPLSLSQGHHESSWENSLSVKISSVKILLALYC